MLTTRPIRLAALIVAAVLVLYPAAATGAVPGPDTYRAIELTAEQRTDYGDPILHDWIDAWYHDRPLHHWNQAHPDTLATYGHEAVNAFIVTYWRNLWIETVKAQQAAEAARAAAERARSGRYIDGVEVCNGGDLPPCYVVRRESGFDPNARNPRSTAWGLYQFLRGTWNGVCPEWPHGSATVAQQAECARRLWAGGAGASHWRATI